MDIQKISLVILPEQEWLQVKQTQQEILDIIKQFQHKQPSGAQGGNITAKEFMTAIRIGRTKFDQLVQASKIKIIKKRRKIYVPVTEIDRYFRDASIP